MSKDAALPTNWTEVPFQDIYELLYGKSLPKRARTDAGMYPVFGSSGVVGDHSEFLVEGPAIIVGRKGSAGSVSRCKDHFWPIDTTYFVKPPDGIDVGFAYYHLQSLHLEHLEKSTAVPGLSRDDAYALRVALPPTNEQRRIVAKIEELFSELDKGVEALTTARQQLTAYRHAILKHAFEGKLSAHWRNGRQSDRKHEDTKWGANRIESIPTNETDELPSLPEGWIYVRLGEFISRIDAGKSFTCDERIPGAKEIGVAKVSAVTWGEYDEDEVKTCLDPAKVNTDYFIREGDFLFSRANTIELVGACVIAKKVSRKVMLSDKTLRLVITTVPPRYVLYYLRSYLGRKEIMRLSTGNQESMRNIGQQRIRSIVVPMCSPDEAEYIQERIQELFSSVDRIEGDIKEQVAKAAILRQSVLKQAFSGQLVAQDPNDEPVSVLLERIRAERQAEAPAKRRINRIRKKKTA